MPSYQFGWNTPAPGVDELGNPITIQVPSSFSIGGIPVNIARAIRAGLNREATKNGTINSVTAKEVIQTVTDVGGPDP